MVDQLDTLMRIAACPCHTVLPIQQVPSFCTVATISGVAFTSTWFSTTSFKTNPFSPAAKRAARRQMRSTRSATPVRPSERRAAHTSMARARRDASGV